MNKPQPTPEQIAYCVASCAAHTRYGEDPLLLTIMTGYFGLDGQNTSSIGKTLSTEVYTEICEILKICILRSLESGGSTRYYEKSSLYEQVRSFWNKLPNSIQRDMEVSLFLKLLMSLLANSKYWRFS